MKKIRNIALFAHVDAGKTTVTEQMLYFCGAVKQPGRVDNGTACSDNLEVEKERGISVKSSCITMFRDNCQINLIDTPGHKDFSSETDRSLFVPDLGILILSAVEGVQGNSERIWKNLAGAKVPVLIFINKLDRMGADYEAVLRKLEKEFGEGFIPFQIPEAVEVRNPVLTPLIKDGVVDNPLFEKLAERSEPLLDSYLEGKQPEREELKREIQRLITEREIYPVLFGTAISGGGVEELLDFIENYIPPFIGSSSGDTAAHVFKVEHRKDLGRTLYLKIYSGVIKNRDLLHNTTKDIYEKINMMKKIYSGKPEDVKKAGPGDIVMVTGMKGTGVGDHIGNSDRIPHNSIKSESVIRVQVSPVNSGDYSALGEALEILTDEDPELKLEWFREEREFHITVMGKIQIEIIQGMLKNRFGIEAETGEPQVIYREALSRTVVCSEEYTMPKPCWAVVSFKIEPGNPGKGVEFKSLVSSDRIEQKYQHEIVRSLEDSLKQGPKGWQVADLKVTLIDGEHHNIHSRAGDFTIATPMALMKGLTEAGTILMEPVLNFRIEVDEDITGKVTGDIIQMRGELANTDISEGKAVITGKVPVSTSLNYPVRLGSVSSGRGTWSAEFAGYQECSDDLGDIREFRGVNPLDRSKFILQARKAL